MLQKISPSALMQIIGITGTVVHAALALFLAVQHSAPAEVWPGVTVSALQIYGMLFYGVGFTGVGLLMRLSGSVQPNVASAAQ